MSNPIQPEGETLRRAVKWLSTERKHHPEKTFAQLINAACLQFDLSPKDAAALTRYTKDDAQNLEDDLP
jgi:hypothetical protein